MTVTIEIIRDLVIVLAMGAYIWRMASWKTSTDGRVKTLEDKGESATSSAWKAKVESKVENLEDRRDGHVTEVARLNDRFDSLGKELGQIKTAIGRIEGKLSSLKGD